jgi:hypothetical protein
MVNFLLNGINNTVTNTVNFARTSAATETAIVAPTANLYMHASQWNTLFAHGNNIYRTYSTDLPTLHTNGLNFTTNGNGTAGAIDYVTTDASDQITDLKFASAGSRYKVGEELTFNMSSQGTSVDNVSATAYALVAGDLDLGSLDRTITDTISVVSAAEAQDAGQYVTGPNKADGTYNDQLSYTYTGNSGAGATLASVTISSNTITAATWSAAGTGYVVSDVFRITVDGTIFADYTIDSGDLSGTAMATLSPATAITKLITMAITGGASGAVVNRITVDSSNEISDFEFSEVGSGFSAGDQLAFTINGILYNNWTIGGAYLTGSLKTTALVSKTIGFVNSTSAGDYANDVITIAVAGGSGTGVIVDTLTVNASHQITAMTFAGRGSGYAAGDTFTFTSVDANGTSRASTAYTLLAADLNTDGSVKDITGKTLAAAGAATAYHAASIRINKRTLATVELSTPAGTALREPEEVEQTIADDAIRNFMFGITGNYNQQGTFSNLETINTSIDDLLTGAGGSTLDALLKASILAANSDTDANTDIGNLSRQLLLQVSSGESSRLTNNAFGQYHSDNILSNFVGVLTGITSTTGTYTTADGIAATTAGSGTGEELESITVRDDKVVGVKFSKPGSGHVAADVITLTGTGLRAAVYAGTVGAVSGASGGPYTDVAMTGGDTSGTGATATVVVGGATTITSITITTPGKGYVNGDTVTFAAGTLGGGSAAVTLTLATADIGTVTFSQPYTLVAGDLDADGGFSNNLYNFTFEANDTLTFQITVAPKAAATNAGQTSINYASKITMI